MISVLCATYGRPYLLEELIESFLRQTYTDAELVILNDRADQTLFFEHPRVRVYNTAERSPFIGTKRRTMAGMAKGDFLAFWDDDDIYLPDHLQTVVDRIPLYAGLMARQKNQWRWLEGDVMVIQPAMYIHTWLIEKNFYHSVGGHVDKTFNEDQAFIKKILHTRKVPGPPTRGLEKPTFILRDCTGREHCSFKHSEKLLTCSERMDFIAKEVDDIGLIGDIQLHPHWHADYTERAQKEWEIVTCQTGR